MAETTNTRPSRRRTTKAATPAPAAETTTTATEDGNVEAVKLRLTEPVETAKYAKFELPKSDGVHCGTVYGPKGATECRIMFL